MWPSNDLACVVPLNAGRTEQQDQTASSDQRAPPSFFEIEIRRRDIANGINKDCVPLPHLILTGKKWLNR